MPPEQARPKIRPIRLSDDDGPRRPPISQVIYLDLRKRIIGLDLKPGEGLNRRSISEEYGASPSPVRDALLRLETEGLVATFPQSRTEVSLIDLAQARETQFLRLGLELEVCRTLALRPDPAEATRKAGYTFALQKEAIAQQDYEQARHWDSEFHYALCEAAGHPALWTLIAERSGHIDRLRILNMPDPGKLANIIAGHEAILTAIRASDPTAAEASVREHLSGTLGAADDLSHRFPDYFQS